MEEEMQVSRKSLLVGVLFATCIGACSTLPKIDGPQLGLSKYRCLAMPSAAYQAGSIIRTTSGGTLDPTKAPPDELTLAYLPIEPVSFSGGIADLEQTVASGISADLILKKFQRLGVALNISPSATYVMSVKAANNSTYVASDDVRLHTLSRLDGAEGRLDGARYFFIKEALGSQSLIYQAKAAEGVVASANLASDTSTLSAKISIRDSANTISSSRELIACIVMEEFKYSVVHAANGVSVFSIQPLKGQVGQEVIQVIEGANP